MPINRLALGASTGFAITLDSLATLTARASAVVDNTTNLYVDAHVSVKFTMAAGTLTGTNEDHYVAIYVYGSEDGTTYGPFGGPSAREAIDGTDRVVSINSTSTFFTMRIGMVNVLLGSGGLAYTSGPLGVAQACGGIMPRRWGIVVHNKTGLAFAATGHSASYSGIGSTT